MTYSDPFVPTIKLDGHTLSAEDALEESSAADCVVVVTDHANFDYAAIIAEAADRGVKLVGYINTQYAARPTSEVKSDVDAWIRFYPRIAGFFLDQQPEDARHSVYVADISGYARSKLRDAVVITNPGRSCDESYLARRASDLVCVFANFEGYTATGSPVHSSSSSESSG